MARAAALTLPWPEAASHWMMQTVERQHGVGTLQALRLHHDRSAALAQMPAAPTLRPRRRS